MPLIAAPVEQDALLGRAPVDLRVNRLKATPETVAPLFPDAAPIAALPDALRLPEGYPVEKDAAWKDGLVEVQDAGSQAILEKLDAQKGRDSWDTDVIVTNQLKTAEMVEAGLLQTYRDRIATGDLVSSANATSALGTDVDGYVMPMFSSQTAIAYNPDLVEDVPQSMDEIKAWAEAHPGAFGYNGRR